MLKRITCCLTLLLMLSAAAAAQERGPSTAEERAKAVRLARELEDDPLGAEARHARAWLFQFITKVPDLDIVVCSTLVAELLETEENYARELSFQPVFSQTAYVIEHPEKANDRDATLLAGIEGMLRAYESILKAEPKARHKFLDDLIVRRDKGQLAAWVAEEAKTRCTAEKRPIK
jgi:carboxypeptidase Q